jgi:hypothetical protein
LKGYLTVGNYNLNAISTNLNNSKVPFKDEGKSISNPINKDDKIEPKQELVSKDYANATKATAMAQILMDNDIKPNMTYTEYIDKLMKRGKIQNKDFKVTTVAESFVIEELNQKGQVIKETIFADEKHNNDIIVKLRNPNNQKVYKAFEYTSDGNLVVAYNNPITGGPLLDEAYNADGSLKNYAMYRKCNKGETSINGDYIISGVDFSES